MSAETTLDRAKKHRVNVVTLAEWLDWKLEDRRKNEKVPFRPDIGFIKGTEYSILIDKRAEIYDGTFLYPDVRIYGKSVVGKNVVIRDFSIIENSKIRDYAEIGSHAVIKNSRVRHHAKIGEAKVEQSVVDHHAEIGYTAQIKRTRFGAYSKMQHHGYLGDCRLGKHANIGAGTITANYDGANKNVTLLKDGTFIGTNANLIAPLVILEGVLVASGTTVPAQTITEKQSLVVGRANLHISHSRKVVRDKKGWHLEPR